MHRGLLYDQLLHVPPIIAGSNLPTGKVDERMVSSVDIATTILHRLGLPTPDAMEGRNLLPPSPISQPQQQEAVFSQYGHFRYSIRTPGWKLIETARPRPSMELYDLHSDPGERSNLYGERADIASVLRERLDKWRENQRLLQHEPGKANLTEEQLERLKGLGYVGGEEPRR